MSYRPRHMEERLRRVSAAWPALFLSGPRQSGKTTLLRHLAEEEDRPRGYVTLDDLCERAVAKEDPGLFLQLHRAPVFIDEAQYAPELFPYLKMAIDEGAPPGSFWLAASQRYGAIRDVSESLAGRVALLSLEPLSRRELCGEPNQIFLPDPEMLRGRRARPASMEETFDRVWAGGMPALHSQPDRNRDDYYADFIATYLLRDVSELYEHADPVTFARFLRGAAAGIGRVLSCRSLARETGIDERKAKRWLGILEDLGIVFLLQPYRNGALRRTIRKPKLYFRDTGLAAYLAGWTSPQVALAGAMNGVLLENYAIAEIMKGYRNAGALGDAFYYRGRDGREIDLVIERDGQLWPIEVKKTANPGADALRAARDLERASLPVGTGAVACFAPSLGAIDSNRLIVPISAL